MSAIRLLPTKGTLALLAIDGPAAATFNTIVEAVPPTYEGPAGNLITLALAAGGTWVPNVGTLTLAGNASAEVAAELDLDSVTGDLDTIVEAAATGVEGNDITVTVVGDSAPAAGVTIDEVGNAVTIHFEDGVSTVGDVETAITAEATLIAVKTTGTGATVLDAATDECTDESLAGGATETVTIGSTVYSWRDSGKVDAAYDVLIGASASASIDNLIAAINANGTPGTEYGTGTLIHPSVRAFAGAGDTMVVHTNSDTILTAVGTLIATTETMASGSWGAATLADGTNGDNVVFSVDGTDVSCVFSSGYTCVEDFEAALAADATASALLRVKTAGTTPLYQLVVTDDDFTATALTGGGTTTSAAPTAGLATAGVAVPHTTDQAALLVHSVAGSGTMTASLKLWGYSPSTSRWYLIGSVNGGVALAEVSSDRLAHAELIVGLRKFSRVYCEVVSLGGTGTEVEVYLDCIPASAVSA